MDRAHRLRTSADFDRVFAAGKRANAGPVSAVVASSGSNEPARIGITVAKGTGSAVARNRVKRRLREIARAELSCIPAGTDVVLVARQEASTKDFQDLADSVRRALRKAGLAC